MQNLVFLIVDILREDTVTPWFSRSDLTAILLDAEVGTRSDVDAAIQTLLDAGGIVARTDPFGNAQLALVGTPE